MKRFTETEKWRDPWFRKLPAMSKLAFLFIVDNCDAAGVWEPDYDLANYVIGTDVNWVQALEDMGSRVEMLKNGKWHLPNFVSFQQGELSEDCRPHQKILALQRTHGIVKTKGIQRVSKATNEVEYNEVESNEVELVYAEYPRKEGKKIALKAIKLALKSKPFGELLEATKAYAAATAEWPETDKQYIPHPATWYNRGSYDDDRAKWSRNAAQPVMR